MVQPGLATSAVRDFEFQISSVPITSAFLCALCGSRFSSFGLIANG
jgi:hypothetical protein